MSTDSWQCLVSLGIPCWEEGVVQRQTRWDVITPCNLEEIHWAAHSQDESPPLVLSLHRQRAVTACKKPEKRSSENHFCLVGVPQGLVQGPSQLSYSPGAMFFPKERHRRQSDCPSCVVWPRRSQPVHNSPEILLGGKRALWSLCWAPGLYLPASISFWLPPMSPYPPPLHFNISIRTKKEMHFKASITHRVHQKNVLISLPGSILQWK